MGTKKGIIPGGGPLVREDVQWPPVRTRVGSATLAGLSGTLLFLATWLPGTRQMLGESLLIR